MVVANERANERANEEGCISLLFISPTTAIKFPSKFRPSYRKSRVILYRPIYSGNLLVSIYIITPRVIGRLREGPLIVDPSLHDGFPEIPLYFYLERD